MKVIAITTLACALTLPAASLADEVTDAVDEAISAYKDGQLTEAVSQLDYAAGLIRQQKAEGILAVFPDPLSGWSAEDAESQSAGGMMMGGGITANRTYNKGNMNISIELVTDSPLLQSMMGMFNNPSLITMNGGKLIKVQGHKAIYNGQQNDPEILLIVNGNAMFTLRTNGASGEDLKAYGEALNLDAL
ncbi:hypothetical protein QWI17_02765 [Gilvimarinus sp. SDUM040013]|uniref:DUF4251 domain-containing protein n=1 Tax=Gilvimarinus gilvus TaxID=3058038 RepID=A0ABU4RZV5_9GAMM|nr:hypothetical protein [Gilvimarinus sp. SDUM040013]MDO3384756.1 hypothetical protein [Gilvimarinus sp. SDUM040013]MDX6850426.1 hypothetical protein [Gilvimarinus sp. SDUM040013]